MTTAKAYPRKSFFLEMFTRDLSLEDAILDLVDNAIDGVARNYAPHMFEAISSMQKAEVKGKHNIAITYSPQRITVTDNCGGIPFKTAIEDVFNFGHAVDFEPQIKGQLGIYGIGLKRAAFKMGHHLRMVSRTANDGFLVDWDIASWGKRDERLEDWTVPIRRVTGVRATAARGTKIVIQRLRPEILTVLQSPEFGDRLWERIATTYIWFLDTYVTVTVNGKQVQPLSPPLGRSENLELAVDKTSLNGVQVRLWAGITERGLKGREERRAGWYVMCNGRVVVAADKSELTGWGEGPAPQWHDKYRGFVGLVFFTSLDNLALPWTTTKRGIHRESAAYVATLNRMKALSRPVLQFLAKQYGPDPEPSRMARDLATNIKTADIHSLPQQSTAFKVPLPKKARTINTTTVRITLPDSKINTARKHLGDPELTARDVVLRVFDAFLDMKGY